MTSNPIIWSPGADRVQASAMYRFMRQAGFDDYESLYQWSIHEAPAFWEAVCDFCDIRFEKAARDTLAHPDDIMNAGWFDGSQLNYAANLLRVDGDRTAIVFVGENGARRELSHAALRADVASVAAGLKSAGVGKGDRVAGFLPNCPEALVAMLATTSIGAIWSSCSPDFGINGVVDRFGQIKPKVIFATNGYHYNGKVCDTRPTIDGLTDRVPGIECVVVLPFVDTLSTDVASACAISWKEFSVPGSPLSFTPGDFDHPPVHHVLFRYDRGAEVHRSRARWDLVAAHEGTRVAHRYLCRGSAVLFYYLRLDDVELVSQRTRNRRHAGAFRRFTIRSRRADTLGHG